MLKSIFIVLNSIFSVQWT